MSKPLGFGVVSTALKRQKAEPEEIAETVGWMKRLNRQAAELAAEFEIRAGTDITGYSLLGHGVEIARASDAALQIVWHQVPFVSGARRLAAEWIFPGGSFDKRQFYAPYVRFSPEIGEIHQMLLFDAQTSGGLLLCDQRRNYQIF